MDDIRVGARASGNDIACPYCNANSNKLLGVDKERRARHIKCRKCDSDYWENQASGLVQLEREQ